MNATSSPALFQPLTLRGLTIPHRLWVAAMCQYSAVEGVVQYWHQVHLGQFAIGRAGMVITEATSVSPEGRISPDDAGLWNEEHVVAWQPITAFSRSQGVPIAVQLAHAGRKASSRSPMKQGHPAVSPDEGGWVPVAPSPVAYGPLTPPHELSTEEVGEMVADFAAAAQRAVRAGFSAIEIHAAHGYLLHEFLSPLSNERTDQYGGSLENRMRAVLDVLDGVRRSVPDSMPVLVRISATDWMEGGWDLEQSRVLAKELEAHGADFIDVSTAGLHPDQKIILGPGYQMPFAAAIRKDVSIPVGTVGLITSPHQAEQALQDGVADAILMARQFLREPSIALRAATELGAPVDWPGQYERAKPRP